MNTKQDVRRSTGGEDGSMLVQVIFWVVVLAIISIAVIDSAAVFMASQSAINVSEEAAKAATDDYQLKRKQAQAEQIAVDYCESRDLFFIDVEPRPDLGGNAYSVTCEKDASTYVFKYLPWFKDLVNQRSTGSSYRSI